MPARQGSFTSPDVEALCAAKLDEDATPLVRSIDGSVGFGIAWIHHAINPLGGIALIKAGWSINVPHGIYARVAPRFDLAVKRAIHVGAGVVDFDYVGEFGVVSFKFGTAALEVNH